MNEYLQNYRIKAKKRAENDILVGIFPLLLFRLMQYRRQCQVILTPTNRLPTRNLTTMKRIMMTMTKKRLQEFPFNHKRYESIDAKETFVE